ncbi:MAG: BamA/TamA family outer membrane protein [Gemmatimonadetes bacterium]|nr:BamA/TamA family outer membrane protein [Gemmatimonadota bacterium]
MIIRREGFLVKRHYPILRALLPFLPLVLAGLLILPAGADAQYSQKSYKILSFEIEGNEVLSDDKIRDAMRLTKGGRFKKGRYLPRWLNTDITELLAFYRTLGYLNVEVVDTDVQRDRDKWEARIRLEIREGEQTVVDSLTFGGLAPELEAGIRPRLLLKTGGPYNPDLIGSDLFRIYNYLAERGYPAAELVHDEQVEGTLARIHYEVDPGPEARIGAITVEGNNRTKARFVLRELTFTEGDLFNRIAILTSRDRIYRTGLYLSVAILPGDITPQGTVPIAIKVRERGVRWFGFGAGFGTQDLVRVSVDWNNSNVLASGKRISLETVFSELLSDRKVEQRYAFSLIEPWMFRTRTVGEWKVSHSRQNIENFTIQSGELEGTVIERYRLVQSSTSFSLSRELSRFSKASIAYSIELSDAGEPTEPVDASFLKPDAVGAITVVYEREARDHLLDPTRGDRFFLSSEYAGTVLGGDNHYVLPVGEAAYYRKLTRGGTLFAMRTQVGWIHSLAGGDLPDYKRFRQGGASTVRGYREESIGPGNFSLLTNVELRVPLVWKFGMAIFADGGNAWESVRDIKWDRFRFSADDDSPVARSDYRYGYGAGLRFTTPIGPIRLDYGRKLKRLPASGTVDRESRDVWHISIGQAY